MIVSCKLYINIKYKLINEVLYKCSGIETYTSTKCQYDYHLSANNDSPGG